MNVTFPNVPHVGHVYLAAYLPTRATVLSTTVAIVVLAAFLAAVGAFYLVVCMGKKVSWQRMGGLFAALLVLVAALGYTTKAWRGQREVSNVLAQPTAQKAVDLARDDMPSKSGWVPKAKQVAADGHTLQNDWTPEDLKVLYQAAAKQGHMKTASNDAIVAVDEQRNWTPQFVSQHGSTFIKDGAKVRCAIQVSDVRKNNAGQPLSAKISKLTCVTPAPAAA